jgi:hypothetical protein
VYLSTEGSRGLEGPYLIASVPTPGKYILSLENGDPAKDGVEVEENCLVLT